MRLNGEFVNNTIVCNGKKDVDLDALNLVTSGEIAVLCPCSYKSENKHHYFIYNTDNDIPLTQLQAGLSFENVVDILSAAGEMMQALAEHHLFLDNVKNAKEYVFKSDAAYRFIYIPIAQKARLCNRDYLLKLISVIHHKDIRLAQFVKELRKKKNDEQTLTYLTAFVASYNAQQSYSEEATSLLDEGATTLLDDDATTLLGAGTNSAEKETSCLIDRDDTVASNPVDYSEEYGFENIDSSLTRSTACFYDESGEYETTVLTSPPADKDRQVDREQESKYCLYFIRNLNSEKISIDVTPFTIGKDSTNMDFVLNNDSVSRHHATIIYENGNYYIMDHNSTNGTMIEGIRLRAGEKGEIENGYIISLGNELFQAHIERR